MRPRMQRGLPPPFYELEAIPFQRLCNDLLAADPEVVTSNEYGTPGQRQYGIDLLAPRHEGLAYDVGQCKCYEIFRPEDIATASQEFFDHWEHWSTWQITRFILFVACDMSNRQRQEAIAEQRARFATHGIQYEVWDATIIRNKLAPHRAIVERHLEPMWVPQICGTDWVPRIQNTPNKGTTIVAYPGGPVGGGNALLLQHLDQLGASFSRGLREQLMAQREGYRAGRKQEVYRWLTALRDDALSWTILQPDVKAQLLRFAAAVELELRDDLSAGEALLDEAQLLDPDGNDRRIRAAIAERTHGLAVAHSLLADETDTDSLNLCASLLLRQGNISEARQVIERLQRLKQADAETVRLLALIHLASHELDQAQLAIQKAREIAPQWFSIRWTAALVDYYSALAPATVETVLVAWPLPVAWACIKRDDTSLMRLRNAAAVFYELATMPDPPDEPVNLLTWHLACLANDPDRQAVAVEVCRHMLHDDPADYRAVTWAVSRSFPIDLQPAERALNQLIAGKRAEASHVQALAACYMTSNRAKRARQLLERTRGLFTAVGADDVWTAWHTEAVALHGKRTELSQILSETGTSSAARTAYAIALYRQVEQTGVWEPLIDYCDRCFAETGNPAWLVQSCEALAQSAQWTALADRASLLVITVTTAQAVQLAAFGLYNAQHYEQCLRLMEQHQELFPQRRLPRELRRVRISCQRMLGILSDAVAEAEALARDDPSPAHMLDLIQAYTDAGDLRKAALASRDLLRYPDLPAEHMLTVTQLVALHDRHLAVDLWRRVIRQPEILADDLVGLAVSLGFQLGCDDEMAALMRRFQELARLGRGRIQQLDIREAIELLQQQQRHHEELNEMYRRGAAPVHVIAELQHWPLVNLYHHVLAANSVAPDPLRQFALLARHGGRPLAAELDSTTRPRLHLDVTALLLAAHLELLEIIEQSFGPLFVPADLVAALIAMRTAVADQQRTTIQVAQQMQALVDQGMLHVLNSNLPSASPAAPMLDADWNTLYAETRNLNGYLVDYLPKRTPDDYETEILLPEDVGQYVCNPRALVAALPYSDAESIKARHALGVEGHQPPSGPVPPLGATIVLAGNVPETFSRGHILNDIARHFQVWIEADELERVRGTLRGSVERQTLEAWLDDVLDHVRQGLGDGRYRVIPFPATAMQRDDHDLTLTPDDRCLITLLLCPTQPNDIIWVDDRCATGYLHRDGVPIVGMNDVLRSLWTGGAIPANTYYDRLLALRSANVRYLSLDTDEVSYHLFQADVDEEGVIETRGLQGLRRYFAACLVQDRFLQRPVVGDQRVMAHGELPFLLISRRAALESLRRAWLSSSDTQVSRARAEWVHKNLYLPSSSVRDFVGRVESPEELRLFLALDLTELLITGMPTRPDDHPDKPAEQTYSAWVVNHILAPRFIADPLLPAAIAECVKPLLTDLIDEGGTAEERTRAIIDGQRMYQALPPIVQEELENDREFMERLGYTLVPTVTIGEHMFERQAFLRAVVEAVNGRSAPLVPHASALEFHLRVCQSPDAPDTLRFEDPHPDGVAVILDPELLLAHESVMERERLLRCNQDWFERPAGVVNRLIASIAALDDAERRIEEAAAWRGRSMSVFYATLLQHLYVRQPLFAEVLVPPDAEELLWYLRLDPAVIEERLFTETLAAAAGTLMADVGLAPAIERLAGLPVPLPDGLLDAIAALSPAQQRMLIKRLLRQSGSPVSLLHLIRIALHIQVTSPAMGRLGRRLARALAGPAGIEAVRTFLVVLRWVDTALGRHGEVRGWAPGKRLVAVWSHAHHLYCTCLMAKASPAQLRSWFDLGAAPISPELFERNQFYWADNVHPHRVHPAMLILDGLAYALEHAATEVCTPALQTQLMTLAFPALDGQAVPNLQLLEMPSTEPSALPSFIGVDRGVALQPLLEEEAAALLSTVSLEEQLEVACERLANEQGQLLDWVIVLTVLHDRRPAPAIGAWVARTVLQTDFVDLIVRDIAMGQLALRAAARQARYLPDDVQRYLRRNVVEIARRFGVQTVEQAQMPEAMDEAGREQIDPRLAVLEAAQTLALTCDGAPAAVQLFATLMIEIIVVWPQMVPWCRPIVQRLWEELPIDQAHLLGPLVLRLRAA